MRPGCLVPAQYKAWGGQERSSAKQEDGPGFANPIRFQGRVSGR